jgi:hypothetical protein
MWTIAYSWIQGPYARRITPSETSQAGSAKPETALERQLRQDQSFVTALNSDKCHVCWNLDPRGHPLAATISVDGTTLTTVEIQYVDSTVQYDPAKRCGYCSMITKVISSFFPFWDYVMDDSGPAAPPKLTTITLIQNQPALLTVQHWVDRKLKYTSIELFKDPDSRIDSLPSLGTILPIEDSAQSDRTLDFIRGCLKTCTEGPFAHTLCMRKTSIVPKRLIMLDWNISEIGASDASRGIMWKVVPGKDCGDYAALSHCWGKDPLPKLEKATPGTEGNMKERYEWSGASSLPKTFQDGMRVALRLDLEYIWIDSLCIIQNDNDDWANEAKHMADYYQGAFVTIAASSSEAGAISFLRPRPPEFKPRKIRFYGPQKKSIFTRPFTPKSSSTIKAKLSSRVTGNTSNHTVSWARTQPSNSKIAGPLATRAWTLQEHILSTRIIHFTDEGVRWQCRTCNKSEDQRLCLPSYLQAWNHFDENPASKRDELQTFWRQILVDYTSRNLTYRKDLLIALAGISQRMHSLHKQPFVAGLWEDRLIEDLCWTVAGDYGYVPPCTHHDDIELPTWSWISVRSAINYLVTDEPGVFTPHSSLLWHNCVREPTDTNPFGRVLSGAILIAGPVVQTEISVAGRNADKQFINLHEPFNTWISHDAPLIEDEATGVLGLLKFKTVRRMRRSIPYVLEEAKYAKVPVYCMYLGQWTPHEQAFALSGVEHRFVLVLVRSARVPDAFERIGMVKSDQVYESQFEGAPVLPLLIV